MATKPKPIPLVSADTILRLLKARHAEDVFVAECKDGPTQTGTHVRMDAWVMKKSWSNPLTTAYEIKVSRSDFLRDNKWMAYLALCNAFYFVCPAGMIQPGEIPEQAGLLCVSANGTILYQKKKAPYRKVQIPESLFRYILMRSQINAPHWDCRPMGYSNHLGADFWRNWLAERDAKKELGLHVSRAIRDHVGRVERENTELKRKHETYEDIRSFLDTIGYGKGFHVARWNVEQRVKEMQELMPLSFRSALLKFSEQANLILKQLEKLDADAKCPSQAA